jgi:hypothetical protein
MAATSATLIVLVLTVMAAAAIGLPMLSQSAGRRAASPSHRPAAAEMTLTGGVGG